MTLCGAHAGVVAGAMNFSGNIGGFLSPMLLPILAQRSGWTAALTSAAALLLSSSTLWLLLRPAGRSRPRADNPPATFRGVGGFTSERS